MNVREALREPVVQFLILGIGLFVLAEITGSANADRADRIVITAGHVERLVDGFYRTWQRQPTAEELDQLVADYVREEILVREALSLGLDLDDSIVRRRLALKMQFLVEDVDAVAPDDAALQAFLDDNPDLFEVEPWLSFHHVYVSESTRGTAALAAAQEILAALSGDEAVDPENVGDTFALPYEYDHVPAGEVAQLFGADFAAALLDAPLDEWSGPFGSGYGLHLVNVAARSAAEVPALAQIRAEVEREWKLRQRDEANAEIYRQLHASYAVSIEWPDWVTAAR